LQSDLQSLNIIIEFKKSKKFGYRYVGLFFMGEYWHERGHDAFQIWRYTLIKLPGIDQSG
jgi:hypothetical protein